MNAILLIDDDLTLLSVMANAMTRRGQQPLTASTHEQALSLGANPNVTRVVLDLRLGEASGLRLIAPLLQENPELKIVVLTGYASIATAVEAIKLGAHHYLTKPADVDDILGAFQDGELPAQSAADEDRPTSLERAEWEYIQQTLQACDGNVSAAAKRLGLHRRTLQRKLQKRPSGMK